MVVTNNHKGALKTAKVAGQISLLQRQPSWNRNTFAQCTREPGQSWKLWTSGELTGSSGGKDVITLPHENHSPFALSSKWERKGVPPTSSPFLLGSQISKKEVRWPLRLWNFMTPAVPQYTHPAQQGLQLMSKVCISQPPSSHVTFNLLYPINQNFMRTWQNKCC